MTDDRDLTPKEFKRKVLNSNARAQRKVAAECDARGDYAQAAIHWDNANKLLEQAKELD